MKADLKFQKFIPTMPSHVQEYIALWIRKEALAPWHDIGVASSKHAQKIVDRDLRSSIIHLNI